MTLGEVVAHRLERLGDADAGHDVLALRVAQEVAVGLVLAGGGVAGEGHAGAGVVTLVAEHHGLHVDRGAEVVGDLLHLAVDLRPLTVPRAEDGLDRVGELLARVLGEVLAGLGEHDRLEPVDETLQVFGGELGVGRDAALLAQVLERVVEALAVDVHHDLAEHLHEAAVGVPREARVVGLLREAADRHVVHAEVEDGVHHARHRERGTRAHRHQQRVGAVAELLAHLGLERGERLADLVEQAVGHPVARGHVGLARVGGDRESGGYRQAEVGHLGEVGPLAAQQVLLLLRALLEREDVTHCVQLLVEWEVKTLRGDDERAGELVVDALAVAVAEAPQDHAERDDRAELAAAPSRRR